MTMDSILDLTVGQLEYLLSGFNEKNKVESKGTSSGKKVLEGQEALNFLISNNGKI